MSSSDSAWHSWYQWVYSPCSTTYMSRLFRMQRQRVFLYLCLAILVPGCFFSSLSRFDLRKPLERQCVCSLIFTLLPKDPLKDFAHIRGVYPPYLFLPTTQHVPIAPNNCSPKGMQPALAFFLRLAGGNTGTAMFLSTNRPPKMRPFPSSAVSWKPI